MENHSLVNSGLICNISQLSIFLPQSSDGLSICRNNTIYESGYFSEFSDTLLYALDYKYSSAERQYFKSKALLPCLKILDLNCIVLNDFSSHLSKTFAISESSSITPQDINFPHLDVKSLRVINN